MMLLALVLLTELQRFDAVVTSSEGSHGIKVIAVLSDDTEIIKHISHWETTSNSIRFSIELETSMIRKLILLDEHDQSIATIKTDKTFHTLKRSDVKNTISTRYYTDACYHGNECPADYHFKDLH